MPCELLRLPNNTSEAAALAGFVRGSKLRDRLETSSMTGQRNTGHGSVFPRAVPGNIKGSRKRCAKSLDSEHHLFRC